jgi:hypothetical protein
VDALAVVVHGYRKLLLRGFLPNHVLVKELLDFQWFGNLVGAAPGRLGLVILQNRVANSDALVADVGAGIVAGGGNEFTDYVLALMTKRTS